ncbi:hypothetical protein OH799_14165 [Nocardia sp. NBC_00881]|uniref:hypothetical protein n=1 Tax=Nocardia sp. NBC_00881 TaxID=2975995 RepID=UPI00386FB07A|nr:hypothetical protein OH799_14165 [Nocardia sp. NBC_00881]
MRLADICKIQPRPSHDLMPKAEVGAELSVPVVKRQHLRDYRVVPDGADAISEDAARRLRKYVLEPDDIALARSGAMLAPAIVGAKQGPMLLGNNLCGCAIAPTSIRCSQVKESTEPEAVPSAPPRGLETATIPTTLTQTRQPQSVS